MQIEGLFPDEIARLDELEALTITGEPITFHVGNAEVLAWFSIEHKVFEC